MEEEQRYQQTTPQNRKGGKGKGCLIGCGGLLLLLLLFGGCAAIFAPSEDGVEETVTVDTTFEEENMEEATTEPVEDESVEEEVQEEAEDEGIEEEELEELEEAVEENTAESTALGTGNFTVGVDIPVGRYNIATDQGASGNLIITSETGSLSINEILGNDFGVSNVTATLADGDEIEISGLSNVYFEPYETIERTEIGTGHWIVGEDVPEGRYVVTINQGNSGNFIVYGGLFPKVNEILGGEYGVEDITFNAEDEDIIEISGIESVQLTEQ